LPGNGRRLHHHAASTVKDFDNPEIAADLERYIASPGFPSRARTAILKLVWDLIGSEFAGRHEQYEKFYGGASFLIKQTWPAPMILRARPAWWIGPWHCRRFERTRRCKTPPMIDNPDQRHL